MACYQVFLDHFEGVYFKLSSGFCDFGIQGEYGGLLRCNTSSCSINVLFVEIKWDPAYLLLRVLLTSVHAHTRVFHTLLPLPFRPSCVHADGKGTEHEYVRVFMCVAICVWPNTKSATLSRARLCVVLFTVFLLGRLCWLLAGRLAACLGNDPLVAG